MGGRWGVGRVSDGVPLCVWVCVCTDTRRGTCAGHILARTMLALELMHLTRRLGALPIVLQSSNVHGLSMHACTSFQISVFSVSKAKTSPNRKCGTRRNFPSHDANEPVLQVSQVDDPLLFARIKHNLRQQVKNQHHDQHGDFVGDEPILGHTISVSYLFAFCFASFECVKNGYPSFYAYWQFCNAFEREVQPRLVYV